MLHTFLLMTSEGWAVVKAKETMRTLMLKVEKVVAEIFNKHIGENIEDGLHCNAHYPSQVKNMPVPLAIVIVAWWTEQRHGHFEDIRREIEDTVRSWDPALATAEVKMNVIGKVNLSDFAKGLPYTYGPRAKS